MVIANFNKSPAVMGVVNVTPDSFSDGGSFMDSEHAVDHALKLIEEGADILDIGGESTKPGAKPVLPDEEQKRVLPVINLLKKRGCSVPISIDTRHADTMQKAVDLGCDIINDISALSYDPKSINVVCDAQIPVILMHSKGLPSTMQDSPSYDDVMAEVYSYLEGRIKFCLGAGVELKNIVVDPGIGFGKRLEDNLSLIRNIHHFEALNCPVLLGASRKSFISDICPNTPPEDRLTGSLAAVLSALDSGVKIFRVHDVAQTVQAISVWQAIRSSV